MTMAYALLFSVFIISTCGLVYELIAGALASYLLGDSVTQFSTIIGAYLFSMGIGSYFSRYFNRNLLALFIRIEILVGLVGGFSATLLFVAFEYVSAFRILLFLLVGLTGILVGLEIPLLMRIMKTHFEFKDLVSKIFTFDYVGALIASVLFPLVLVPHLGLARSALFFGIINVLVGLWTLWIFRNEGNWVHVHRLIAIAALLILSLGFIFADRIVSFAEAASYPDPIVFAKASPYQRIVLTKGGDDFRLFLNGNLQFSSRDEYRYHEALVHMTLAALPDAKRVLVLGGGDGLAVREILKYGQIESITLVDLDTEMTDLFKRHPALTGLNQDSLNHPRVQVLNEDAFLWLKKNQEQFDFIVVDFPDPSNFSVGKLYTNTFYKELRRALSINGAGVVQSTSPFVAKKSFWCVEATLKSVGFLTEPYHVFVPAFGDWGYLQFSNRRLESPYLFPEGLRYLNSEVAASLKVFSNDMRVASSPVNRLNNQILVRFFEEEWANYAH